MVTTGSKPPVIHKAPNDRERPHPGQVQGRFGVSWLLDEHRRALKLTAFDAHAENA